MHFVRKPWTLNELLDQVAALMLARPVPPAAKTPGPQPTDRW